MTRTPMEGVFSRYQCSYQQKDGKAFEHASITFTLGGGHSKQDDEENWTNLKKGSTARGQTMDTKGLAGIGDEAFITRKKDPMSFQTILYVRKGGYHFILDAQDLKQEPVEALKEIGKKIAASL